MHVPRCTACERAVYGGPVNQMDPCKAAYSLFHEISELCGVRKTHEENVEALEDFVTYPVNRDMISFIAQKASDVIPCAPSDPNAATDSSSIPKLDYFIASIVERSHCQVPTLMSSLVYLARLKDRLPNIAQGLPCTRHRLFLAALILSAKYVNDSSPKNKHWAAYSQIKSYPTFGFSLTEVNLMEKQLLFLLDFDLSISESDLLTHFEPFLAQVRWDRSSDRLEKELARRGLVIDEEAQLPAPIFSRPAPPKGAMPPTASERERAHKIGVLYPDEERHQYLMSKVEHEASGTKVFNEVFGEKAIATAPILATNQEEPYLVSEHTNSVHEREEDYSYTKKSKSNRKASAARAEKAMFNLESDVSMESFDNYTPYEEIHLHSNYPVEMSRSSTQDSYLSNNSSRFNSVSREITPASSMTSLSGDDIDYSCHDDEDQVDVYLNGLDSTNGSTNPSPEFQYQYRLPSTKSATPPLSYAQALKHTEGSHTRSRTSPYKSLSPQARAQHGGSPQRVSPTQGHTGVGKKVKVSESKSMARIRQTLQGLDAESVDGVRATKRSRFLPRFLGGSTN